MCGIGGAYFEGPWTQQEKAAMLKKVLVNIEHRGKHATGFANIGVMNGTMHIGKAPVPASHFVKMPVWTKEHWGDLVLLHTRYATHGDPKENKNNHPHESDDWVQIHNGVIRTPALADYAYRSDCDSEIALSFVQVHGLPEGLKKLWGSMALALVNKAQLGVLHLYCDGNPIVVQEYRQGKRYAFIFSSEGVDGLVNKEKFFSMPIDGVRLGSGILYSFDLVRGSFTKMKVEKEKEPKLIRATPVVKTDKHQPSIFDRKPSEVLTENERLRQERERLEAGRELDEGCGYTH